MFKKVLCLIASILLLIGWGVTANAAGSNEKLVECYFTSDSKYLKFYFNGQVEDDAVVKITTNEYKPTVSNNVEVKTTFMIDNTRSISKPMQEVLINAVKEYIKRMPSNESARIVALQKFMIPLMDSYTTEVSKLEHALDQITFEYQGSYIYDCINQGIEQLYGDDDACYRLVVITDGCAGNGGDISFDYIRSLIETKNRYHIDFVQVGDTSKLVEDTNMKSLALMSSNTYHMLHKDDTDLSYLALGDISLIKLSMNNSLTTGEYRGVKVSATNLDADVGSIYFPQAYDVDDTDSSDDNRWIIMAIIVSVVLILVVAVIVIVFLLINSKENVVEMCVTISKEDLRDNNGVGDYYWKFPIKNTFLVGRVLEPKNAQNIPKEKNNFAIIETATEEDETSIGRNSFEISCDYYKGKCHCKIKNIADVAKLYITVDNLQKEVNKGEICELNEQMQILIGRYTTITIKSLEVKSYPKKDLPKFSK